MLNHSIGKWYSYLGLYPRGYHAVSLRPVSGSVPLDIIEVEM